MHLQTRDRQTDTQVGAGGDWLADGRPLDGTFGELEDLLFMLL